MARSDRRRNWRQGLAALCIVAMAAVVLPFSPVGGVAAGETASPAATADEFLVTRAGDVYTAASSGSTYTGTLKVVVEDAVGELGTLGGGTITFAADTFDLGTDYFEFDDIADITFQGQGMATTTITNDSSVDDDTEPFDVVGGNRLVVRDLAVSANGVPRTTSDALDFDDVSNSTVERVKVLASRSRGIIFDGKGPGWQATGNQVHDCVIGAVPDDGIELLAAANNTVMGCTITGVGGRGIQLNKSSTTAPQPNKQSTDNQILLNTIDQAGRDGVNVLSGARNTIASNTITNSSDDVTSRSGIRIEPIGGVSCNDNRVEGNTATDNQTPKTQRFGLHITNAACNHTVVLDNSLDGNAVGNVRDDGTNTRYHPFSDVPNWVLKAVNWLYSNDYVTGYNDDTFRPNNYITRAQVARMLHRIEGSPPPGADCTTVLTDVPNWAKDAICWLYNNDYATGFNDDTFRPNDNITRAQVARMLHRIEGEPDPGADCTAVLTDVPNWAEDAICWLYNNGYATGFNDDTFRPNNDITRAQVARMVHRVAGEPGPLV